MNYFATLALGLSLSSVCWAGEHFNRTIVANLCAPLVRATGAPKQTVLTDSGFPLGVFAQRLRNNRFEEMSSKEKLDFLVTHYFHEAGWSFQELDGHVSQMMSILWVSVPKYERRGFPKRWVQTESVAKIFERMVTLHGARPGFVHEVRGSALSLALGVAMGPLPYSTPVRQPDLQAARYLLSLEDLRYPAEHWHAILRGMNERLANLRGVSATEYNLIRRQIVREYEGRCSAP